MLLQLLTVAALVAMVRTEQGSCPPTLAVDLREAQCGPETPCNDPQLCCPTWLGGAMCVDPVTRRHFTTLVKKGRCPENPRGAWICADSCTGDSDCVRALKCCHNRCGALTCQKPEPEPETTVPTPTTLAPVVSDKPLYNPEPTFNPLNPFFPSAPLYNPSRIPSNNWGPAPFPANSVPFPSVPFPYGPGSYPVGPTAPTSFSGFPEFHFLTPTSSAVRPAFPDFSENTRDRSASQPRSNNRVSWPDDNNVRG